MVLRAPLPIPLPTPTTAPHYAYLFRAISAMARRAVRVAAATGGLLLATVTAACPTSARIRAVSTQPAATIAATVSLSVVC